MQGSLGPAGRRPLGRLGIGTLALTPLVHMLAPRHGLGQDDRGLLQRVTHGFPSLLLKLRVLQEAFLIEFRLSSPDQLSAHTCPCALTRASTRHRRATLRIVRVDVQSHCGQPLGAVWATCSGASPGRLIRPVTLSYYLEQNLIRNEYISQWIPSS